jgi:hypothetical protein
MYHNTLNQQSTDPGCDIKAQVLTRTTFERCGITLADFAIGSELLAAEGH